MLFVADSIQFLPLTPY